MYLVVAHVDFEYHVAAGYVLVIQLETALRVDFGKYLFAKIIVKNVGKLTILVNYFATLIIQEVLLDVLGDLLLLIFDIGGDVFFLG